MKRFVLLLGLVSFSFITLLAQIPANPIGINPPSLKWRQINTDKVQVIFPKGLESQGNRVANVVHYLWDHHNESIGDQNHKVTILLQNQTIIPNGFVTVGPFRSEFFMTPPQFNCTTNWLDILAIHEYQHVKQFGNGTRGISKLAKNLFGSWAWGGFVSTALPRWFFEGDAVIAETALTNSGRGRLPAFNMEYRSLVLNDINYTYEKAAAGSLKDFVPDWYRIGYYMTTHARRRFGQDIWQGVVEDAVKYKGIFFPFSKGLKKRTGLGTKQLYQEMRAELDSLWKNPEKSLDDRIGEVRNIKQKKTVANYNNPLYTETGSVIFEKTSFDQITTFYQLGKEGNELKITTPGIIIDAPNSTLSYANGKICWAELGFDLRWQNRNYSVIKICDLASKKKKTIKAKTRYFSPALSHKGDRIVTVEVTQDLQYNLIVLDANTGHVLNKFPNPEGWFYSFPRWTDDDENIVVVTLKGESNQLRLFNVKSGKSQALTKPSNHQITHPFPKGEYVYFSSAYTGINNIFVLKIGAPELYQVTSDPLGAFQPAISFDGKKLIYSEFNVKGYDIRETNINPDNWKLYTPQTPNILSYHDHLVEYTGGSIIEKVPDKDFEIKKFNKWSGIINPHSFLPFIDHPIYGARILSDNKFSTMTAQAGAFYNTNEDEWTFLAGLSYAELFPVINLNFRRANRNGVFINFEPHTDTTIIQNFTIEDWRENNITGGISIPLNLSKGHFFNSLRLSANYGRLNMKVASIEDTPNNFRDRDTFRVNVNAFENFFLPPIQSENLNALDYRLTFRSFRRRALQHLNARFGFNLDLRYRTTFDSGDIHGDVFLGRADLFLPGFSKNHSFYVNGMYQRQAVLDNYRFSDLFIEPRGYNSLIGDKLLKIGFNYSLPLWYPDKAIGPLAFLKRVKTNFFFDYGNRKWDEPFAVNDNFYSAGIELTFDIRAIRLLEIDFGLRYSYLWDNNPELNLAPGGQKHQFDFLLISITE